MMPMSMTSGDSRLLDQDTLAEAMRCLAEADASIAEAMENGLVVPSLRQRPSGFETFLTVIISQQLSVAAARTIKERVFALMPDGIGPISFLHLDDEHLRKAGMSWRKIEYAKGLCQASVDGKFDADKLERLSDEDAITSITALRGFGTWSAEIYLLFSLGRQDVFPADDLALQVAFQKLKQLDKRPTAKVLRSMTEHWAPWRSVGALFLWEFYAEQKRPLK